MTSVRDYALNLLNAKIQSANTYRPPKHPKLTYEPMLDHHVVANHRGLPVAVPMIRATHMVYGKNYGLSKAGGREANRRLSRMN